MWCKTSNKPRFVVPQNAYGDWCTANLTLIMYIYTIVLSDCFATEYCMFGHFRLLFVSDNVWLWHFYFWYNFGVKHVFLDFQTQMDRMMYIVVVVDIITIWFILWRVSVIFQELVGWWYLKYISYLEENSMLTPV